MKHRQEILSIIHDEQLKAQRTVMSPSPYTHSELKIDESICKILANYLMGNDTRLLEPTKLAEYIKIIKNNGSDTISLFGGLRLCIISNYLVLEYAEPFEINKDEYYDQIIQLIFDDEGCIIDNYCVLPRDKINKIKVDKLLKTMPFDEKRMATIVDYMSKVYQLMPHKEKIIK